MSKHSIYGFARRGLQLRAGNHADHTEHQSDEKSDDGVDGDGSVIRFAGAAIVAGAAFAAADVTEHPRSQCSTPPGEADLLGMTLGAAMGAVGVVAARPRDPPWPAHCRFVIPLSPVLLPQDRHYRNIVLRQRRKSVV